MARISTRLWSISLQPDANFFIYVLFRLEAEKTLLGLIEDDGLEPFGVVLLLFLLSTALLGVEVYDVFASPNG